MIELLRTRLHQGHRTLPGTVDEPRLPENYRGRPTLRPALCTRGCARCVERCPTGAIEATPLRMDLAACLFCGACARACPTGAITFCRDHRLAVSSRDELRLSGEELPLARALDEKARRLFGRSLQLRQVSAGGCSGCELELAAMGNIEYDLNRFGVHFVASPRHADGIVVTGPVTRAMEAPLRETLAAVPAPRIVIAVGACALSGGAFAGSPAVADGLPRDLAPCLLVPGCPPHPLTVMDGILRLLGRLG